MYNPFLGRPGHESTFLLKPQAARETSKQQFNMNMSDLLKTITLFQQIKEYL